MVRKITTIQVHEDVKNVLDRMKETDKDTYEEVILKLAEKARRQKKEFEKLMIEGCKEMHEDTLKMNKEWEAVDAELDWEWKE